MKKGILFGIVFLIITQILYAQNTITVANTMYQNQAFSSKDKEIFDSDWEGLRVWRWSKAQSYCKKLKLDGYDGWRVASQKELQTIMSKKPSRKGLFAKSKFRMPALGGKYNDVWMWTRDSKSSKVGGFVNFKKAKSGWADKSYKGYVICTRSTRKIPISKDGLRKDKNAVLFEYEKKILQSDMTAKGIKSLGNYSLLYFYCQNGLEPSIPRPSSLIKHNKMTYFFAYKGKNKKTLNLYRTNGTAKGTKKIGTIGNTVAYSPIWVGDKLYFLSSAYLPQQADPLEEKLWVLDTTVNRLKYVGETANESKGNMYPFAKSKTKLFFKYVSYDSKRKKRFQEIWVASQHKGLKKVKRFSKVPDNLKNIKVAGKNHKLKPLDCLTWGCE